MSLRRRICEAATKREKMSPRGISLKERKRRPGSAAKSRAARLLRHPFFTHPVTKGLLIAAIVGVATVLIGVGIAYLHFARLRKRNSRRAQSPIPPCSSALRSRCRLATRQTSMTLWLNCAGAVTPIRAPVGWAGTTSALMRSKFSPAKILFS